MRVDEKERSQVHFMRRVSCLEFVLVAAGHNDVVDLEDHAAQLGGEQELLALGDERVDDEVLLHVCEVGC